MSGLLVPNPGDVTVMQLAGGCYNIHQWEDYGNGTEQEIIHLCAEQWDAMIDRAMMLRVNGIAPWEFIVNDRGEITSDRSPSSDSSDNVVSDGA